MIATGQRVTPAGLQSVFESRVGGVRFGRGSSEIWVATALLASGGNSTDGHPWLTHANETDYAMWPLYYGRSYPSKGEDALTYCSGGFLWENAQNKGKSVAVFGEYAPSTKVSSSAYHMRSLEFFQGHRRDYAAHRTMLRERYNTKSDIPSLDPVAGPRISRLDRGSRRRHQGRQHPRASRRIGFGQRHAQPRDGDLHSDHTQGTRRSSGL